MGSWCQCGPESSSQPWLCVRITWEALKTRPHPNHVRQNLWGRSQPSAVFKALPVIPVCSGVESHSQCCTAPLPWSSSREPPLLGNFVIDEVGPQGIARMADGLLRKLTHKKASKCCLCSCNSGTCPLLAFSTSPGLEHREGLWFPSYLRPRTTPLGLTGSENISLLQGKPSLQSHLKRYGLAPWSQQGSRHSL